MIKRPMWDECDVTVGVAKTDAQIEHGDRVLLKIGDLRIVVRVQEGALEKSLKKGEYLGIVRSIEGSTNESPDLEWGDQVVFECRHVCKLDKETVEGGWI
jgi:hypothetical protein